MSTINQKEYLKKYLGIGKGSVDKKKKKKSKKLGTGLKIVDDDVDVNLNQEIQDDLAQDNEDAPQIVSIIDERPPSLRVDEETHSNLWKPIGAPEESSHTSNSVKFEGSLKLARSKDTAVLKYNSSSSYEKSKSKYLSPPRKNKLLNESSNSRNPKKENSKNDSPAPRYKKEDDLFSSGSKREEYMSPSRKSRKDDSDYSPERKVKREESEDFSPPRKNRQKSESDSSPPRRHMNKSNKYMSPNGKSEKVDFDSSPPRKIKREKSEDFSPPRKRRKCDSDCSPPRKTQRYRRDSLSPPPRRAEKIDAVDMSPPRRIKREDSDSSPPRRTGKKHDEDMSPPRKRKITESDSSPPRRNKNSDGSPPPEKRDKHAKKSRWGDFEETDDKMKKTLDGKTAGLQNAQDLVKETRELKKREDEIFRNMSADVSGANAATVVRGKKKEIDWEEEERKRKKEEENKEKYNKWGRGLKQVEDVNEKIKNDLYEMSKPLARYADDKDLEKYLKEQEREGDPMLAYIRQKKKSKSVKEGKPVLQQYEGDAPPNRFGIRPGYRWDGVDRSNGYEKQWFQVQNSRKASLDESYKWSTEDM